VKAREGSLLHRPSFPSSTEASLSFLQFLRPFILPPNWPAVSAWHTPPLTLPSFLTMADRIQAVKQAHAQTLPQPRQLHPASLRARIAAQADPKDKKKERSPSTRLAKLLLWVFLIHVGAIYLFTRGFLLSRSVLDSKSECKVTNMDESALSEGMLDKDGCWYPQQYKKAVVIIIDALRFE